jgi:hypothetical protein
VAGPEAEDGGDCPSDLGGAGLGTVGTVTAGVETAGVVTLGVETVGKVTVGTVTVGTVTGGTVMVGSATPDVGPADRGTANAAATGMTSPARSAAATTSNRLTSVERPGRPNGYGVRRTAKTSPMSNPQDERADGDSAEGWESRVETCRIVLWRGYLTSAFYARATDDPAGEPIGESSTPFRWRRAAVPDTPEARSAHREVVSRLEENGWTPTGRGAEWYATDLARTVLVPSRGSADDPPAAEASLPEREPEPEPAPAPPRFVPPPPPRPVRPAPARARVRAPGVQAPRSTRRIAGWRVAAAAGLVTAIGLLGWVATHPSSVEGAAPAPTRAPAAIAPAYPEAPVAEAF